jgi:hypothetical protein
MKTINSADSGFVRLGLLLLGIMIWCFWKGGQDLYTALANTKPTVMSYEEYVQKRPKATWLKLTDCRLNLPEAAYKYYSNTKVPTELFIPVRGLESREGDKTVVFLASRNPELLATYREMMNLKSEEDGLAWALKNHERVFPKRDVAGLVRFGIEMRDSERSKLAKLQAKAADDFIMLDDGSRPSLASGIGFFGGGLLLLVGGIAFLRRSRDDSPAEV